MATFNYYGTRNKRINKDNSMSVCSRYAAQENWEHIVTYPMLRSKQKRFLCDLYNKLKKEDKLE